MLHAAESHLQYRAAQATGRGQIIQSLGACLKPVQRVWLGPGTGAVGLRTLVPFQSRSPLKHLPVGQDLRFRLREVLSLGSIYPTSCPSLALGAELKGRKKSNPQKDHPHPSSNSLAQPFDKLACSFPLVNPSAAIFPPPL